MTPTPNAQDHHARVWLFYCICTARKQIQPRAFVPSGDPWLPLNHAAFWPSDLTVKPDPTTPDQQGLVVNDYISPCMNGRIDIFSEIRQW